MNRFIWLVLLLPQLAAASGWIAEFDGPPAAYKVVFGEEAIEPELFQQLQPGTVIEVRARRFYLSVAYPDGRVQKISKAESPWVVEDLGKTPDVLDHFLNWASSAIENLKGDEHYPPMNMLSRSAGSFGQPLRLIFPGPKSPIVLMDEAPLQLIYWGGEEDSEFELTGADGAKVMFGQVERLPYGYVKSTVVDGALTSPGSYTLSSVTDPSDSVSVEIVQQMSLPQPEIVEAQGLAPEVGKLGYLAWLANQDGGRYAAISYQLLDQESSIPAQYLKNLITHKYGKPEKPEIVEVTGHSAP